MVDTRARVPMTLREQFLQDPFFSSSLTDMDRMREEFWQQSQLTRERFDDQCWVGGRRNSREKSSLKSRDWVMPRQWMMPDKEICDTQDSNLISLKDDDSKMEISLNTSGYKPSELRVNVVDDEISIEGRHEERSEGGQTMISRQFSRRYNLPLEAVVSEVESNLSQDGILVVTIPKEKRIKEIKESEKSKESKVFGSKRKSKESEKLPESLVPLTMRDSFFNDPVFKDNWLDMETSQKNFFEEAQKQFEERWKSMQSQIGRGQSKITEGISDDNDLIFKAKDSNVIHFVNDDSKLEVSLDITGYKPDELKVTAGQGMICVEGKHEEKSEAGQVMVSREFSRKYSMPASSRAEEVLSNLSKDGVLVISVPKRKIVEEDRSVEIRVE